MKPGSPFRPVRQWASRLFSLKKKNPHPPSAEHVLPGPPPPVTPGDQPILEQPLLVFDLETSGLNMQRDQVLAIGAVRIEHNAIALAGHIDSVLQVEASLKPDSQLLHGLSQEDLQRGQPAAPVLQDLMRYGTDCIWLAFHAGFDQDMLDRALRRHLGVGFQQTLFDIATLAPMLFPQHQQRDAGLEHWAHIFALDTSARHSAAADALLSAELALVLLCEAQRQGLTTWQQLAHAQRQWRQRQDGAQGPMF